MNLNFPDICIKSLLEPQEWTKPSLTDRLSSLLESQSGCVGTVTRHNWSGAKLSLYPLDFGGYIYPLGSAGLRASKIMANVPICMLSALLALIVFLSLVLYGSIGLQCYLSLIYVHVVYLYSLRILRVGNATWQSTVNNPTRPILIEQNMQQDGLHVTEHM